MTVGTERRRRPLGLRGRLLIGIALAIVLPVVLFLIFGVEGLGRATSRPLIEGDLRGRARLLARAVEARIDRGEDLAILIHVSLFEEGRALPSDLDAWALRVGGRVASSGRIWILDQEGRELLRADGRGRLVGEGGPRSLPEGWLQRIAEARGVLRLPPIPDPLTRVRPLEQSRDPSDWVLPLGLPLKDETQSFRGALLFLLPMIGFATDLEAAREGLAIGNALDRRRAWLLDTGTGRYLLHSDRDRVGAASGSVSGFSEQEDGRVLAAASVGGIPGWQVGVEGRRQDFAFGSVQELRRSFAWIVLLLLLSTLGIATWIGFVSTRSLRRLEDVTEAFGAGRLDTRARVRGPREVRALASALNGMAEQLEKDRERVQKAERDRAWTEMARQVAHEIKNPLQPMRLHGELIRDRAGEDEGVRSSAQVILRQVESLSRIVRGFSDFASSADQEEARRPESVAGLLERLAELYALRKGLEVRSEAGDARILMRVRQLEQVLVNLVNNAFEASAEAEARVLLRARVEDEAVLIEVLDRGRGLPEDLDLEDFGPFDSKKPGAAASASRSAGGSSRAWGAPLPASAGGGGTLARVVLPPAA